MVSWQEDFAEAVLKLTALGLNQRTGKSILLEPLAGSALEPCPMRKYLSLSLLVGIA